MTVYAGLYSEILTINRRLTTGQAVTVYERGTTTLATLYTDRLKSSTMANPVVSDSQANLVFYAEPGSYDLSAGGLTVPVVVGNDPAETFGAVLAEAIAPDVAFTSRYPTIDNVLATVRQYGLVVDGATDQTAALQQLIDNIAARDDEGVILFDATDDLVAAGINLKEGVSLRGLSQRHSVIEAPVGSAKGIIQIGSGPVKRCTVSDLTLKGNAANTGQWGIYAKSVADGSTTGGLWYSNFERVTVTNTKAGGVYLQGGPVGGLLPHQFLRFAGCDFKYNVSAPATWIGCRIAGQSGQIVFEQCEFTGDTTNQNVANAVYISRHADDDGVLSGDDTHPYTIHFDTCAFQGSLLAVRIDRANSVVFTAPYFEDNKSGILAENSAGPITLVAPRWADSASNGATTGYAAKVSGTSFMRIINPYINGAVDADVWQTSLDGRLVIESNHPTNQLAAGDVIAAAWTNAATHPGWYQTADGKQWWSSGAAIADVNLYRSSADVLNTDDTIQAVRFAVNGTTGAGVLQFNAEQSTAPTTPGTGAAKVYLRDNGSGKSQIVIRYDDGSIGVIDTQV